MQIRCTHRAIERNRKRCGYLTLQADLVISERYGPKNLARM